MRGCMKVPMRGRAGVVSLGLLYLLYLMVYPMHDLRMHTPLCMHMPLRMCTRCMQYAYACAYARSIVDTRQAPMRARIFELSCLCTCVRMRKGMCIGMYMPWHVRAPKYIPRRRVCAVEGCLYTRMHVS